MSRYRGFPDIREIFNIYVSEDIEVSCQPRSCSLDFPSNLRQNRRNSPRKMFLPPSTDSTNHTRLNPSEYNLNIERHTVFIWLSIDYSQFSYYYGHTFNFIRCRTTLCTYFFPAICVTQLPSTPSRSTLWPSGFFYTVQKFLLSDILRCIGITRRKKVFLSVSLYCLLCGRYKVRIFIIRLNSLKHSQ